MFDRLVAPRLSLPITAGVLLALLCVLATLQYRWLGQVAEDGAGGGTAFTLVLPGVPVSRLAAPSAEERNAQTDPAG